jgi:hypothetical protein
MNFDHKRFRSTPSQTIKSLSFSAGSSAHDHPCSAQMVTRKAVLFRPWSAQQFAGGNSRTDRHRSSRASPRRNFKWLFERHFQSIFARTLGPKIYTGDWTSIYKGCSSENGTGWHGTSIQSGLTKLSHFFICWSMDMLLKKNVGWSANHITQPRIRHGCQADRIYYISIT